ncbi:MAG: tRNA pseudouridine(38-40) synthase TruA [Phaeodactylibacter sp.]|uniref:tRNA pseudouridine(38-40) synthase TruA n=1 Tax=Phaeodactylibacter sp. TaxID=1940289 RepID=UPI0032EB0321
MRYFLHFAYQGYYFRGWQQQPGAVRTVQGVMEGTLQRILKHEISLVGCGRTDAQVHASQFFAHFDTPAPLPERFRFILNKTLPDTISVFEVIQVADRAHARYDATARQYDYLIHTEKQAFLAQLSTLYEHAPLDVEQMREAAALLPEYQDFRAFCLKPDRHNTTLCTVEQVRLFVNASGTRLRFQITANRFLRGMIRIIVYRLLEVGSGKISIAEFERPLQEKKSAGPTRSALPQGLYLSQVQYPYFDVPPKVRLDFER